VDACSREILLYLTNQVFKASRQLKETYRCWNVDLGKLIYEVSDSLRAISEPLVSLKAERGREHTLKLKS
jgi:hypothetical protein